MRGVSVRDVPASFPPAVDLSQMLSQKDRLGSAATRMDLLVRGGGVTVPEEIADAEKVA